MWKKEAFVINCVHYAYDFRCIGPCINNHSMTSHETMYHFSSVHASEALYMDLVFMHNYLLL